MFQPGIEHPLAGHIEVIGVNQGEQGATPRSRAAGAMGNAPNKELMKCVDGLFRRRRARRLPNSSVLTTYQFELSFYAG